MGVQSRRPLVRSVRAATALTARRIAVLAAAILAMATVAGMPAASAKPGTAGALASAHSVNHAGQDARHPVGTAPEPDKSAGPGFVVPEQPNLTGAFVPVTPVRLLDTRSGIGTQGVKARVGQNTIQLDVSGITGNPSVQPTAVVLNVTVVDPTQSTFVTVYPNGTPLPGTSNLNASAGETVANQVTVPVGLDGMVDFYNADGLTDIVADLAGYFTLDKAASNYVADGPHRILDTRNGTGGVTGPLGAGQSLPLQITGTQGVPATGVTAVVLNVTATAATESSFLTVYPDGQSVPASSDLNFLPGETRPNLVTVQVGADGKVDFYNDAGDVQVVVDLAGYYVSGSPQTGAVFQSTGPTRILDTRNGTGGIDAPVGPNQSISLQIAGNGAVPSSGATAVVLNVTATAATKSSFLTVYPDGESVPASSNLNFVSGETIPNLVVVPLGADGKVDFYNDTGDVQVVVDLFGYFQAGSHLGVSALSFASPTVDAAAGNNLNPVSQTVNFTVTDSDPTATSVAGEVVIRQFGPSAGSYVGQPLEFSFSEGSSLLNGATFVSGTPASSTYSYTFGMPAYAAASSVTWGVSLISIYDDPGGQESVLSGSALSGLSNTFTATEQVEGATPTYSGLSVTTGSALVNPPYVYNDVGGLAIYSIDVRDPGSGVWQGSLTITGPGGITRTAPFWAYADASLTQTWPCQNESNLSLLADDDVSCSPEVFIPAGAPAGTWAVTSISLTNNAGLSQNYTGLDLAPITVASRGALSASNFKVTPAQVNNWRSNATTTVSMDITGAQDGVSSIQVFTSDFGSACSQQSTTPTQNADGSYGVPLTIDQVLENGSTCTINGIAVTDGAGDLALYGSDFTTTALNLEVTNVPDTTPPVVTAAAMSVTSIEQSQLASQGNTVYVTAQTETLMAPISQYSTTVYDSSGTAVAGQATVAEVSASGQVELGLGLESTPALAVGTYTVAFALTDSGGLTTSYGGPGQNPVPGGPLTFTVTAG